MARSLFALSVLAALLLVGCSGGDTASNESVESAMKQAGVKAGPGGSGKKGEMPKAGDKTSPPPTSGS